MSRLLRYVRLWRTLPDAERRARAGRVVERLLRRRPAIRRLGILADQPRWWSLRRALAADLDETVHRLRDDDERRGPLHAGLTRRAAEVASRRPEHADRMLGRARELLERRFDLLGSGPSRPLLPDGRIDWHRDWKSGIRWEPGTYHRDLVVVRGDGSDIKLPWELSRFQHLLVLGQAYLLAPHRLPKTESAGLRGRCVEETVAQLDDWIARNPRGLGVNWACTMDVAIRAYNWLAALALFRRAPELDDAFLRRLLRSLWVHGRHIRRNLEIGADGLTSNHYLSDLVGLYALGCALPELRESEEWRETSRRAVLEEIDRQVLPDGADFERSIPYHRLVTELFLHAELLARCSGHPMPDAFRERLGLMLEFTAACSRPDGTVPQWGDNDDGRLLPLDGYAAHRPHDHRHLLALGAAVLNDGGLAAIAGERDVEAIWLLGRRRLPDPGPPPSPQSRAFTAAGYYVMRDDQLHLGVACGKVGTRGVGNHTHNDLFSVAVWAGGREWIVDPGTGCYSGDPELRNRLRSTSAHATLQLGEREQNPFGDTLDDLFLLREAADPEVLEWRTSTDGARLSARHRGFGDDGTTWTHRREIRFDSARRSWIILDELSGADGSRGEPTRDERVLVRFPLAPEVTVRPHDVGATWPETPRCLLDEQGEAEPGSVRRAVEMVAPDGRRFWIALRLPAGSSVEIDAAAYSPRYGVTLEGPVVVATVPLATRVGVVSVLFAPEPDADR